MAFIKSPDASYLDDLLKRLGNIPASRIRMKPLPGEATERDVVEVERREGRLCELVDGTLVEKVMGAPESFLAGEIIQTLGPFVKQHRLGFLLGEGGMARLLPGLVRIPDVSFFSWRHFPNRKVPADAIAARPPDLAVEVLSRGNTKQEIRRKLKEYFLGGTQLVWILDPKTRTARAHTAPDAFAEIGEGGALDGGDLLPGFRLPLRDLFDQMEDTTGKASSPKKSPRNGGNRR